VIQLLRTIERHHQRFGSPPIGPIGAHVVSKKQYVCLLIILYRVSKFKIRLVISKVKKSP
jgi:hypothetical protein